MKLKIRKVDYIKGEMHFILKEVESPEDLKKVERSFTYEIAREVSRKQAVKPLVLNRRE